MAMYRKIKNNVVSFIPVIFWIIFFLLIANFADARPGGGHSYSGGGGGGGGGSFSGGGSGGGGGESPFLGLIIFVVFLIIVIIKQIKIKMQGGVRLVSNAQVQNIKNRNRAISKKIEKLKLTDPNFSKTLFIDFVSSVLYKFYSLNSKTEIYNLAPYFSKDILDAYSLPKFSIFDVVIGAVNIYDIKEVDNMQYIVLDFDFNYTLTQEDKTSRFISKERWNFVRNAGVQSFEPQKMRELACPNCGGSLHFNDAGKCNNCGSFVKTGEKQWTVKNFTNTKRDYFKTSGLAHYEKEIGTIERTITQYNIRQIFANFAEKHSKTSEELKKHFKENIVQQYFTRMYEAWSTNKLNTVRNILTDRLYTSWMFWIDNYKKEGLSNKLDNLNISKVEFVKIEEDKFYESVTVRIFASCFDYVEDKTGTLKGGSKRNIRKFSEYWTFIRRNGVEKDDFDLSTCPNCGAPADKMGQSGMCEYCNTKISNGDFSWVLAIIIQDEVYKG